MGTFSQFWSTTNITSGRTRAVSALRTIPSLNSQQPHITFLATTQRLHTKSYHATLRPTTKYFLISVLVTSLSVTLSVTTHRVLRLTKRPPLIPLAAHLLLDLSLSSQRLLVHRVYVGSHTTAPDYLWPCTFLFDVPVKSKVTHLSKGLLPTSIRT